MINVQEPLLCHMGVDLRCGQVPVAQKFLDAPQVGPPIEQVGRETVPQRMRAGVAADPGDRARVGGHFVERAGEEGEVFAGQPRPDGDETVLVDQAGQYLGGRPPRAGLRRPRPDRLQALAQSTMPLLHPFRFPYSGRPCGANPRYRRAGSASGTIEITTLRFVVLKAYGTGTAAARPGNAHGAGDLANRLAPGPFAR